MKSRQKKRRQRILKYIQDYRFNSILVKSFGIILTVLVATYTVIMLAVYHKMNSIIADEVGNMSINSLAKTCERIDVVMEEAVKISGQLSLDEDVLSFLLPGTKDIFGRNQTTKVKSKIEQYAGVFDYIDSIYVFSNKSKFIITNEGGGKIEEFNDQTWVENLIEREYEPARMISRTKYGTYPHLISYMQPMRLTQMQFLGGIIVNIDVDKLRELVVAQGNEELLLIVDNRDNIIFSTKYDYMERKIDKIDFYNEIEFKDTEGYQILNDGKQDILITVASSELFDWKYISAIPLQVYKEYNNAIFNYYTQLFLACIIISIIASFIISLYCYNPVKSILDLLKNPDIYAEGYTGDTGLRKDETHEIALNIVRNLYSNQLMQDEMKSYTNLINKAQLTALQAQISPHFLFNTLENIRWRAIAAYKGDNEVAEMILNLSEMLRVSLESEQPIITIEEEIRNAKLYIKILQLRYEDKVEVIWEADESLLKHPIVKVSLQPIIENAVYHGIKPLRAKGIITIRLEQQDDRVFIKVSDNGAGMSAKEVQNLNTDMKEKYILQEDHIGIRNVNQRLRLLMGDAAGLEIDKDGILAEIVPYKIGFRRIEIKNQVMLLNGKRLIINGVNRHEWSAEGGRCIGIKEMECDVRILLRNHVNAVRTSHYPNQIPWYYMCDENGIYMMAETNLESHGSWQKAGAVEPSWNVPGSIKQWKNVIMDRAGTHFETFKNHTSILFWSLGNESYAGDNLKCMNRFYKEKDESRLVHYEGVFHNRRYESAVSDVESRMYATPEEIMEYLDNRPSKPVILCEYMHNMGNSLGGMRAYMELLNKYDGYQGGFIWDYIDQALWIQDEITKEKVLRYGGDFDDRPSDYEFSGNGILFADRSEKPAVQEVRHYYGIYR